MEIELTIITVNYNGLKDTCELIDSITLSDSMEVIVVDNGSLEDEASVIGRRYPFVRAIRSEANLGFAGGNNLGIKAARGKYLFLVNNDAMVGPGLEQLTAHLSPPAGMVCPKIRFAWGERRLQYAGYTPLSAITLRNSSIGYGEADHGQHDQPHPTPYAHGAAMLVSREAVERAGLMPECYFLYYEELDWSLMIRRAGYDILYDPSCTVYHKESQATGQQSPLRSYYIARNRLLFAQRNIPAPRRYITYAYLIGAVAARDVAMHTLRGRTAHAKATLRGIADFVRGRQGRM